MIDLREKIKRIIDSKTEEGVYSVLDDSSIELIQQIFENYEHTNALQQDMNNIPKQAQLIFIAGPTGAGKDSLVIKFNVQSPDKRYIELNMDIFRHYFTKFIPDLTKLNDRTFAQETNEFSYEIYATIQDILLQEFPGTNIIITGTLRETDWVEETFRKYKANELTNYDIKLVSLAVPKQESGISVIKRYISLVDLQRRSGDFLPGTSRYTNLNYHDETYERFPISLAYFEDMFNKNPGELIDSMEVYKRSRVIDDYTEDTLVYTSEDEKFNNTSALEAVMRLRGAKPNIRNSDILKIFEKIKRNEQYLREQGIFGELIIDLGICLELGHIMDKRAGARKFHDSNDDNDEPGI